MSEVTFPLRSKQRTTVLAEYGKMRGEFGSDYPFGATWSRKCPPDTTLSEYPGAINPCEKYPGRNEPFLHENLVCCRAHAEAIQESAAAAGLSPPPIVLGDVGGAGAAIGSGTKRTLALLSGEEPGSASKRARTETFVPSADVQAPFAPAPVFERPTFTAAPPPPPPAPAPEERRRATRFAIEDLYTPDYEVKRSPGESMTFDPAFREFTLLERSAPPPEYSEQTLNNLYNLIGTKVEQVQSCDPIIGEGRPIHSTVCVKMTNRAEIYPSRDFSSTLWEVVPDKRIPVANRIAIPSESSFAQEASMAANLKGAELTEVKINPKTSQIHLFFNLTNGNKLEFRAPSYNVVPSVVFCGKKLKGRKVTQAKAVTSPRYPDTGTFSIVLDGWIEMFPTSGKQLIAWNGYAGVPSEGFYYLSTKPSETDLKTFQDSIVGATLADIQVLPDAISLTFKRGDTVMTFFASDWQITKAALDALMCSERDQLSPNFWDRSLPSRFPVKERSPNRIPRKVGEDITALALRLRTANKPGYDYY